MEQIKQSRNEIQVVGIIKEMNMAIETKEVEINGKKVTCKQIGKKEFKNPMFVIESNGQDIPVDFFAINEKKAGENGQIVENPRFKSMQTVMETYVPKSVDAENPTRVIVKGSLGVSEYPDKKSFEFKSYPQISGFSISSSNVPENDIAEGELTCVIKSIIPEVVNDEETGRLKVECYSFDYTGSAKPTNFIVENDLADAFNDLYEVGNSVKLYYEVLVKLVGAKKTVSSGGFGRRNSQMVSGFNITEYSIFKGDEPFEEENEYYVGIDDMKEALNERDIFIQKKIDEAKNSDKTPKSASPKNATPKNNPFGGATERKNPFA